MSRLAPLVLAVAFFATQAEASAGPALAPDDPAAALRAGRRAFREDGDDSILRSVASRGAPWDARVRLARAAAAREAPARAGEALGVPMVDAWLALRNDPATDAPAIVRFAQPLLNEAIGIEALGEAASRARVGAERKLVYDAVSRTLGSAPPGLRGRTVLLLALSRSAPGEAERRSALSELSAAVPDAPERAPGFFTPEEVRAFRQVALAAPLAARVLRARAVMVVRPDEAAALLSRNTPGAAPGDRLSAAEILLATGHVTECERELRQLEAAGPPYADGRRALLAAAGLRRFSQPVPLGSSRSRRGGPAGQAGRAAAGKPGPTGKGDPAEFARLKADAAASLARPLPNGLKARVLGELMKAARSAGRIDDVRLAARGLVEIDPGTSTGAEDLFQDAFASYRAGGTGDRTAVADAFGGIAVTYRNVAIRRRAVYWQAKSLDRAGDPIARSLFASLLTGTSPDVYARWAAEALGVELSTVPPEPSEEQSAAPPWSPSREYLAAGLDGLAELAAESEGSLDPLFAAALSSERQDYRRVAAILKGAHPALGTPEEGGVPIEVRRLFYPVAHLRIVVEEADRSGVSPSLLCGLIRQESLFQDTIVSRSGAVGLMQVMPATGRQLHRQEGGRGRVNLSSPEENVRLGSRFFGNLLAAFGGDVALALAAYNAGPGRAARWKRESAGVPADEWIESIPFAETRDYVKRVLFFSGAYAALYGLPAPPAPSGSAAAGSAAVRPAGAPTASSRPFGGR